MVGQLQVVEPPEAIKSVLVQWNGIKLDLALLARLRWIEKKKISEISQILGRKRSCIKASTRTIRNTGILNLNLSSQEQKLIEIQISEEKKKLKGASQ